MNTLFLEKRGCNFMKTDPVCNESNVGNYRVCTPDYIVPGRDGKTYFVEICRYDKRVMRRTNKRNGMPLKRPVMETVMNNACAVDVCFTDPETGSWKDCNISRRAMETPRKYTIENILAIVNEFSAIHYDNVAFVGNVDAE